MKTRVGEPPYTGIDMSHIRVGGGIPGLIFAAGTVYIFLLGIPAIRSFFLWAVGGGLIVSIALRLFQKYKPSRPATPITR